MSNPSKEELWDDEGLTDFGWEFFVPHRPNEGDLIMWNDVICLVLTHWFFGEPDEWTYEFSPYSPTYCVRVLTLDEDETTTTIPLRWTRPFEVAND